MKSKLLIALSLVLSTSWFQPAQAALNSHMDSENGHTLSIGVFGLSYDYTYENFSIGTSFNTQQYQLLPTPNYGYGSNFNANLRSTWKWLKTDDLTLGLVGGATVISGSPGERSYFQPDLGLGMAYQFSLWNLPMALRLNIAWTIQEDNEYNQATNILQRIGLGPSSGIEFAMKPAENMEITLGGGSILGMRLKF